MSRKPSAIYRNVIWILAGACVGVLAGLFLDSALWYVSKEFFYENVELGSVPHPEFAVLTRATIEGGTLGAVFQSCYLAIHRLAPPYSRDWFAIMLRTVCRVLMMALVTGVVGAAIYLLFFYDEQNYQPDSLNDWVVLYREAVAYFAIIGAYGGVLLQALLCAVNARHEKTGLSAIWPIPERKRSSGCKPDRCSKRRSRRCPCRC